MEKIYITRKDYVEYGKDCDGDYRISLFLHNLEEKYNGRTFLTYRLYKTALSALKKHIKKYREEPDDLFLSKENCDRIYRCFDELETE